MIWDRETEHWLAPDDIYDRVRDERDEYESTFEDDLAMAMWDPQSGWTDG